MEERCWLNHRAPGKYLAALWDFLSGSYFFFLHPTRKYTSKNLGAAHLLSNASFSLLLETSPFLSSREPPPPLLFCGWGHGMSSSPGFRYNDGFTWPRLGQLAIPFSWPEVKGPQTDIGPRSGHGDSILGLAETMEKEWTISMWVAKWIGHRPRHAACGHLCPRREWAWLRGKPIQRTQNWEKERINFKMSSFGNLDPAISEFIPGVFSCKNNEIYIYFFCLR